MKRFYCTICKRHVRVRRLPDGVELTQGPKGPIYTNGQCRHHGESVPRAVIQGRAPQRPERTMFVSPGIPLAPDAGRAQRPRKRA